MGGGVSFIDGHVDDPSLVRYRCIKCFELEVYDDNGFTDDGSIVIKAGDIYETCDEYNERLMIANHPAVHLVLISDKNIHHWIEIYPDTLEEYFERVN